MGYGAAQGRGQNSPVRQFPTADPFDLAGTANFYANYVNGVLEGFFEDDLNQKVQLTSAGLMNVPGATSAIPRQESITTQNITTDTLMADTLNFNPSSDAALALFLNGVQQEQGTTKDYTRTGQSILWRASSGTAVDMSTTDVLIAIYESAP